MARATLSLFALLALAATAAAGPAVPGGPFLCPYNSSDDFDAWRVTAAFDMDRDTGPQADWTGWVEGDPTPGNGHAYDNHSGTDWGMPTGTDLFACEDGTVTAVRESVPNDDHSDTGNYIIYTCDVGGDTYQINNWHLAQNGALVGVGESITRGQHIAESDNTGNSTGPHLHFGIENLSASALYTCPFFNGWFSQDEYYYGDTRPCLRYLEVTATTLNIREGTSTSYDIITSAPQGARFVASQRNGWYRIFLPSAPARAYESRTSGGGVTSSPLYAETGSWTSSGDKSTISDPVGDANRVTLVGAGSRRVAAGSSATARFVPNLTQRGQYEVFATWPAQASATGVTYTVSHLGGSNNVVLNQVSGLSPGGSGTKADPYIIAGYPYVADHTTIGGEDDWDSYSPVGSGIDESGPERIYRFTVAAPTTVTIEIEQPDSHPYPTYDVDIQLLYSLSNNDCQARADWSITNHSLPSAGTYYIAVDTYDADSRACPYTLRVTFAEGTAMANSWVSLGTYEFDRGQSATQGSVTIDASTASGSWVYADAVKFVPVVWRSAWFSDSYVNVLDGASDGVCCVGVRADATPGDDARDIDDIIEVPIHSSPDVNSRVVGKAVSGQRFVCTNIWNDFYYVFLTNACDEPRGWISGEYLFVYHPDRAANAVPVELSLLGAE